MIKKEIRVFCLNIKDFTRQSLCPNSPSFDEELYFRKVVENGIVFRNLKSFEDALNSGLSGYFYYFKEMGYQELDYLIGEEEQ